MFLVLGVGNRSLGWDPHLPGAGGGNWWMMHSRWGASEKWWKP